MRLRGRSAAWMVPTLATALALGAAVVSGAAFGAPAHAAPAQAPGTGNRIWSVRPAAPSGAPDNRTHFTLQGTPGSVIHDNVLVTNLSQVTVSFGVYATDAFNTASGQFDLLPANRKPVDIGSWLTFSRSIVTIGAGKSVPIAFTVSIPASATPGDHSGGVVVSLSAPGTGPGVKLDSRVAVRLYLRVPGNLRPRLDVDAVNAQYHGVSSPFGHGRVTVTYHVTNTGNIRLQSHTALTVKSPFGSTLAHLPATTLPELLPGGSATFSATFDHVFPAGPLTVSVGLAPLADPLQPVGQKIPATTRSGYTWAMPWTLLLLIAILLLLGGGFWWLRHRRVLARIDSAMAVARADALTPEGASR
jgi:hypothetical protein